MISYLSRDNLCGMDTYLNLTKCLCGQEKYDSYPDLKIQLGNNLYTLPKESYIRAMDGSCFFKIMSMNFTTGTGVWVLGASFLHNYLAIFDLDNKRVGLVGASEHASVPWTVIEYLTVFAIGLLVLTVLMVFINLCPCKRSPEDDFHRFQGGRRTTLSSDLKRGFGDQSSVFPLLTREGSLAPSNLTSPNMGSVLSAGERMNLRMVS